MVARARNAGGYAAAGLPAARGALGACPRFLALSGWGWSGQGEGLYGEVPDSPGSAGGYQGAAGEPCDHRDLVPASGGPEPVGLLGRGAPARW